MRYFHDTHDLISYLKAHNALRIIDTPLDIYLEIPHLAYLEVKKPDSKALLFTHPIDKKANKHFEIPVLMNVFGSRTLLDLIVQKDGLFYTPSLECGLLNGLLRQFLLRLGRVKESVLYKKDLLKAQKIYAINSVRGLVELDLEQK